MAIAITPPSYDIVRRKFSTKLQREREREGERKKKSRKKEKQKERERERASERASWMPNDMATAGNRAPQVEFPSLFLPVLWMCTVFAWSTPSLMGCRVWSQVMAFGGPIALECFVHISDKRIPARLKWSSNVFNHFDCGSYSIRGYNAMISFPFRYLLLWEFKGIEWNILGTWWNMMGIYLSKSDEVHLKHLKEKPRRNHGFSPCWFWSFCSSNESAYPWEAGYTLNPKDLWRSPPTTLPGHSILSFFLQPFGQGGLLSGIPGELIFGNQNKPWSIWLSH